jgi:hypothetical protein
MGQATMPLHDDAFANLLDRLGLKRELRTRVRLLGEDPVVPSRYRPGLASPRARAAHRQSASPRSGDYAAVASNRSR